MRIISYLILLIMMI